MVRFNETEEVEELVGNLAPLLFFRKIYFTVVSVILASVTFTFYHVYSFPENPKEFVHILTISV